MRRRSDTPSLARIAEEAGVSRAAVSMALRHHPRIPVATRERIEAIAKRLGWKPNPLLAEAMSAIRAGQPPADRVTLAWVTTFPERDGWRDIHYFLRLHEGCVARAARAGYKLEHFWLGDARGNVSRLGDILYNRGINGVIIAPMAQPGSLDLPWKHFASATMGFSVTSPRLHRVTDNHTASVRVGITRLRGAGFKRIGFAISGNFDRRVNGLWTAGYLWQTNEDGDFKPELLHRPDELDETTFVRWVREEKPDAIISVDRRIPDWLAGAGMRIPRDVAYVNLDIAAPDGSVAGVYQDPEGIGACCVDMVAGQLLRHERGLPVKPRTVIIDGRWCDGTTAPACDPESEAAQKADRLLCNEGNFPELLPSAFD
ncbi:LacI family DNA-binding transcriptional regulator [Synoicihabitans lomoniglobus]|uniref:LacI family DNA-binding transcriptional regulator n=1 Tax=Synoicihabitans lomoniglobus TaxID=2909285 RepID=A0AAE9ZRT1_9BACT|nr:LacI family transcriptional regulator [Opitutaceae bacterium LMO-M01]WED63012.1 LacI family DNA-binding transcriptional regulator [Opitutaceae bacterium LMO-M01]